jgi:hypothetical protein
MIVETVFAGRDNTFSLQLIRGDEQLNLLGISGYSLVFSDGRVIDDQERFLAKSAGIVEISLGDLFASTERGTYVVNLITYDPVNENGVQWPSFKLKVK